MTRKPKQLRLLPATAPIREGDALDFAALATRYRCRCGNTAKTGIRLEEVASTRTVYGLWIDAPQTLGNQGETA